MWSYGYSWNVFWYGRDLLLEISIKFGSNKFRKRTVWRLQTRIYFRKKSRDQAYEIIDQIHLTKSSPNFTSCQGICKYYAVTSNCDLRMCRFFEF